MSGVVTDSLATVEECRRVFGNVPFLSVLDAADMATLAPMVHARDFIPGTTIFYEDDETDSVYFIASGSVEVFKSDREGKKLHLVVLREAGVLGEMGLLNRMPRTATARTLTAARLLRLNGEEFNQALQQSNPAALRLVLGFARVMAQRLSEMDMKLFDLFQSDPENPRWRNLVDFKQGLLAQWPVNHW